MADHSQIMKEIWARRRRGELPMPEWHHTEEAKRAIRRAALKRASEGRLGWQKCIHYWRISQPVSVCLGVCKKCRRQVWFPADEDTRRLLCELRARMVEGVTISKFTVEDRHFAD